MLVDAIAGHSLMDVIGYNKIKIHLLDAEKTVFKTRYGQF